MSDLSIGGFLDAGVAQWLEHHVANVNVEGSNPFTRSLFFGKPVPAKTQGQGTLFRVSRSVIGNAFGYNVGPLGWADLCDDVYPKWSEIEFDFPHVSVLSQFGN